MADMLYKATKYMNAEDAMIVEGGRAKKRERQDDPHQDKGRKSTWMNDQRDDRRPRPPPGRIANFTPLNTSLDQVLMQIKDDMTLTWPDKLKGDPSKRSRNKYCHFHWDHGHNTFKCYDLKQQIEALIKQVKLQRFVRREKARENSLRDSEPNRQAEKWLRAPLGEIRVIVGGSTMTGSSRKARKTYLRMVQSVKITGRLPKLMRVDDPTINFTEENARWLHLPHDDTLVINLSIANFNTRWVLIDNGISADIFYYPTFQQMRIDKEWLLASDTPLLGFGGTKVFPVGTITLLVNIGTYPQ